MATMIPQSGGNGNDVQEYLHLSDIMNFTTLSGIPSYIHGCDVSDKMIDSESEFFFGGVGSQSNSSSVRVSRGFHAKGGKLIELPRLNNYYTHPCTYNSVSVRMNNEYFVLFRSGNGTDDNEWKSPVTSIPANGNLSNIDCMIWDEGDATSRYWKTITGNINNPFNAVFSGKTAIGVKKDATTCTLIILCSASNQQIRPSDGAIAIIDFSIDYANKSISIIGGNMIRPVHSSMGIIFGAVNNNGIVTLFTRYASEIDSEIATGGQYSEFSAYTANWRYCDIVRQVVIDINQKQLVSYSDVSKQSSEIYKYGMIAKRLIRHNGKCYLIGVRQSPHSLKNTSNSEMIPVDFAIIEMTSDNNGLYTPNKETKIAKMWDKASGTFTFSSPIAQLVFYDSNYLYIPIVTNMGKYNSSDNNNVLIQISGFESYNLYNNLSKIRTIEL